MTASPIAAGLLLRPVAAADLPACVDVFYEATEELHERTAQPAMPRNPEAMARFFGHLLSTDPERSWLAERDGRVVAFGIAHRREAAWFLAFLFVLPGEQAVGLGRSLVGACMAVDHADVDAGHVSVAVCAEAIQPVSMGLYATLGMLPRTPLFLLTGRPADGVRLSAVHDLATEPFEDFAARDHAGLARIVDELDREALGYAHPQDHRFYRTLGRRGMLLRDSGTGEIVGYGYAHESGRVGPVVTRDARWLPEALDHVMASVRPSDAYQLFVPGPCAALAPLLRAGMRFTGAPAIHGSSGGDPAFDRYVVSSPALL